MNNEIIITDGDSPLISQPSPVLVGGEPSVVVQENFVGGQNATIQIGSVETLPEGSQAYVKNVGTETHAVLDFGLVTGNTGASGSDGVDGSDGQAATIQVGTVTTGLPNTNAIVTNVGTQNAAILDFTIPQGIQGLQGIQGVAGVDGISPRAYVEQITGGARVVIEDSENTTTADIMNGTDGTDGVDGFSPIATVTPTASGATISITDSQGTTTANITNGADGFSPIATVTQNTGSATISIQDSQGTTTATVYDGQNGTDGTDGVTPSITATASVDNTTGIPSVTVTKTGTDANPSFAFAFQHLKGETGNGFVDYSTSEVDTGIKWIDGSTIYRKVFEGTASITGNTITAINTGTSAKSIINAYGYFDSWHSGSNYNRVAFGQYDGTNIYSAALIRNASTIELQFISSINVSSQYAVVVEYIK